MTLAERTLRHFRYEHLPVYLQDVSQPFAELANGLVRRVAEERACPTETYEALRDLLRAKDCAVRAAVRP